MHARSRGLTLVETLVALVVLSIGLLGAVAMLVDSMRTHTDALRRLAAVNLLRDMADRIRVNPRGRHAYDTRSGAGLASCAASACGPAERAATDRVHFITAAARISPRTATVSFEPATGPAAFEHFVISLDVGRDPSEPDVVTTIVAQTPVAGGA